MNLFGNFFFIFVVVIIILSLWSAFERHQFTRLEGKLKRGFRVWTAPLHWEARQFLDTLPATIENDQSYIRVQGREFLIAEKRSAWKNYGRRSRGLYVAYVNLSLPESRIEFRTPWSDLAAIIIPLLLIFIFFSGFSLPTEPGFQSPIFFFFVLVALLVVVGSAVVSYYHARNRLLGILSRAMEN